MKNKKKLIAVTTSLVTATALLVGGVFAFFIDKDWTSDIGTVGTVYIDVTDFSMTNSENINPGDWDEDLWSQAETNNSESSLRTGTEHQINFTVDNLGTKSVITRNVITITVENVTYEPITYDTAAAGSGGYVDASETAPDNRMYISDTNNSLKVTQDELGNYYIYGTEVIYNDTTGYYEYTDATTGQLITFSATDTDAAKIVHWKYGVLSSNVFSLLYDYNTVGNTHSTSVTNEEADANIVSTTTEIDCLPTTNSYYSNTDVFALLSENADTNKETVFEVWTRSSFDVNGDDGVMALRYVTPAIELAATEGSIEDADGTGTTQTNNTTQGGLVVTDDLDSVYYTYWLAMDKDASNMYNGATVYIDVEVQGLQYRNTSDYEWLTLFTDTFVLTVENASQTYDIIDTYYDIDPSYTTTPSYSTYY